MKDYYMMWLSEVKGLQRNDMLLLLKEFEYPENVWKVKKDVLGKLIGEEKAASIIKSKDSSYLKNKAVFLEKYGIKYMSLQNDRYPYLLKNIFDPPWGLYIRGELPADNNLFVSVVGSRNCTAYSGEVARRFSYELAGNGVVIVSGMAIGIDSIANKAALEAGGKTIAVLGSGIDVCYPKSNRELMEEIAQNGCVITEFPPGTTPRKWNFPRRNRIISGLSQGLLLIEAGAKSGTRTTVDCSLENGREVFVVPGDVLSGNYAGSNEYLLNGAHIAISAENIMEYFNYKPVPVFSGSLKVASPSSVYPENKTIPVEFSGNTQQEEKISETPENNPAYKKLSDKEKLICDMIWENSADIETLNRNSEISVREIQIILTSLELKGLIKEISGNKYVKA